MSVARRSGSTKGGHAPPSDVIVAGVDDGSGTVREQHFRALPDPRLLPSRGPVSIRKAIDEQRQLRAGEREMTPYERFSMRVSRLVERVERVLASIEEEESIDRDYLRMIGAGLLHLYVEQMQQRQAAERAKRQAREDALKKEKAEAEKRQREEAAHMRELQQRARGNSKPFKQEEEEKKKKARLEEAGAKRKAEGKLSVTNKPSESKPAETNADVQRDADTMANSLRRRLYRWPKELLLELGTRVAPPIPPYHSKMLLGLPGADAQQKERAKIPIDGIVHRAIRDLPFYRIMNSDGWHWWNGSSCFSVTVTMTLNEGEFSPGETTQMRKLDREQVEIAVTVGPHEERHFFLGVLRSPHPRPSFACRIIDGYIAMLQTERDETFRAEARAVRRLYAALEEVREKLRGNLINGGVVEPNLEQELVIKECLERGIKFVDEEFSLITGIDDGEVSPARAEWFVDCKFPPQTFVRSIDPYDVVQGALADHRFLNAVASLADRPDCVLALFDHPDTNLPEERRVEKTHFEQRLAGAFRVWLNDSGWWRQVIVDSYLPAIAAPIFATSRSHKNEMWISIIEKAYAKMYGSYRAIVNVPTAHFLTDLTGFPTRSIRLDSKGNQHCGPLFGELKSQRQRGYLMLIDTPRSRSSEDKERYASVGLTPGHTYSLLDVCEVVVSDGTKHQLVQLRNVVGDPGRRRNDGGESSPRSQKVARVIEECKLATREDEKVLWMSFQDCFKYFMWIHVCALQNNWTDYRIKGMLVGGKSSVALEITVHKQSSFLFTLSQARKAEDKNYASVLLSLVQRGTNGRFSPLKHASEDPESHGKKGVEYQKRREISMLVSLSPRVDAQPYLLIVREFTNTQTIPFNIGLLAQDRAGPSTFSVRFVCVTATTATSELRYDPAAGVVVSSEFQRRDIRGTYMFNGSFLCE